MIEGSKIVWDAILKAREIRPPAGRRTGMSLQALLTTGLLNVDDSFRQALAESLRRPLWLNLSQPALEL